MAHLQILFSLLSLIGIASIIKKLCGLNHSLAVFYATIFITFALYFAAILNLLEPSVHIVRNIGLLGLLISAKNIIKTKINYSDLYIIISIAVFYVFCQTEPYSIFPFIDDYNHWGRMSRYIAENNRLINSTDMISVKDYPPIASLFHYFFTYFSGYKDSKAIFANGVLTIIFSSPLFIALSSDAILKKNNDFILISLSVISLYWVFGLGLHSLWADLLLGVGFGIALHIYFDLQWKNRSAALIAALPVLLFMVQVKQIGILFAFFALLIMLVDYIRKEKSGVFIKTVLIGAAAILLILFDTTWKNYLIVNEVDKTFSLKLSLDTIISAFNPATMNQGQYVTIQKFIDHLFFSHHLSTYWFLISLIMLAAIVKFRNIKISDTDVFIYLSVYIMFFAYMFILLLLYLFAFGDHKGTKLGSIERYTITYILGVLIFLGGIIINISETQSNRSKKIWLVLIALAIVLPNTGRLLMDLTRVVNNSPPAHTAGIIHRMSKSVIEKTPENSKIYIIWSEGSNDESVIFNYYLMPRKNNADCIFIKPPFSEKETI